MQFCQIFTFSSNAAGNILGKNFQEYILRRRIWKHVTKYIKHSVKFPHGEHNVDWNAHFENIPDVLKFFKEFLLTFGKKMECTEPSINHKLVIFTDIFWYL